MTRTITIIPALNGFICAVGCQQIVFEGKKRMLQELARYYANPNAVEKKYLLNRTNSLAGPATMEAAPMEAAPAPAPDFLAPLSKRRRT